MLKALIVIILILNIQSLIAGELIDQVFFKNQISLNEAQEIFSKYPELINESIARVTQLDSKNDEVSLKLYLENTNEVIYIQKSDKGFDFKKMTLDLQVEMKAYDGVIHGNLYDSVLEDVQNKKVASIIAEAFKNEFSTTKGLRVTSRYMFDIESYYDNGEFVKFGRIPSAKIIVGLAVVEKILVQDTTKNIFELKTFIPESDERQFTSPIGSNLISSLFSLARRHPLKKRIQPHNGVDFLAKSGTSIFPSLEGEIIAIGRTRAKGKFVLIQHENGFQTIYDHLKKFQKGLRVGAYVERSDQIGEVGRTGYATGAHLHFGIIKNGFYVNPIYYLKDYQLDESDGVEFEE